jgi:type IVB pilus formation R64 PilN family outer membrane protein
MRPQYALAFASILAGGCSGIPLMAEKVESGIERAVSLQEQSPSPSPRVMVQEDPYVDVKPIPVRRELPAIFAQEVVYRGQVPTPIDRVLRRVQDLAGVEVVVESAVVRDDAQNGGAPNPQHPSNFLEGIPPTEGIPLQQVINQLGLENVKESQTVALDYKGALRGLLDEIAIQTGLQWRWDDRSRKVVFFGSEVAWFHISAGATEQTVRSRFGGTGGGGGQFQDASTAQIEYAQEAAVAVMQDVETILRGMLSSNGRMAVVPRLGYIAVRDVPERVEAIRQWIERFNAMYERHVHLVVDIYRVEINDLRGESIEANLRVFENLAGERGIFRVVNTGFDVRDLNTAAGQASVVLRPAVPGRRQPFGGSQVIANWLSNIGKVSHERQVKLTTVPGRPVPYRVVRRIAYVASATETVGGVSGVNTTQLQPAQVEVGLQLMLTPRIHPDGERIHLHMLMSLSTLDALDVFASGNQRVQTPRVSTVEYAQESWLNDGDVLVVTGLETSERDYGRNVGILAFGRKTDERRNLLVVAVRPVIVPLDKIREGGEQ